jgi:transcriptional regulator with XRE-family HTH domain
VEVNVERLQDLRRQKVLSRRELEEMSSPSHNTTWRLKTGKTEAHSRTIRRIAEVLGEERAELIRKGS